MGGRRRALSRKARRACDTRNEIAAWVAFTARQLDRATEALTEADNAAGQARWQWARIELADALRRFRKADRRVQRLMAW